MKYCQSTSRVQAKVLQNLRVLQQPHSEQPNAQELIADGYQMDGMPCILKAVLSNAMAI